MNIKASIYNIHLIVKDYIRTIKLPKTKSKTPVVVLLVGIPASGKSYLAQNLATSLPLALVSENDIQSFLVPKISFFEKGHDQIRDFAKETVKQLVKNKIGCILDMNLAKIAIRQEFGKIVNDLGGEVVIIHLNCPTLAAYDRIKKRNLEIIKGEVGGFIMDWDYFQYEINQTEAPVKKERALTFDSSKPDHQLEKIVLYLEGKIS